MKIQQKGRSMRKLILVTFIMISVQLLQGQNYVQWTNLVSCTSTTYGTIQKNVNNTDYNTGGESQQKLAIGQDGWIEFTLREASYRKTIGLSFMHSSSSKRDSIAYGFAFNLSNAGRIRKYTSGGARDTSKTFTYALNDKFRIEKVGTKILFFKNGVKLDSSTTYPSTWACFVDASIRDYNGRFDSVRTNFQATSFTTVYPDKDSYIYKVYGTADSTTNSSTGTTLVMARASTNGKPFIGRELMQIDFSSIPRNAKICNSVLYLSYVSNGVLAHRVQSPATSNEARVYRNTSDWTESTVTWATRPSYDSLSYYKKINTNPTEVYNYSRNDTIDMSYFSSQWVYGNYSNYGFVLKLNSEFNAYQSKAYASSDYTTDVSKKPKVEITYTIGTNYYVNDNSRTGDVYCKAVGSSSNNGLSPYKPKASVSDVINTYPLGPKDTIFVDAGSYTDAITFTSNDCGSALGQLVLCGAGKDKTTITASANNHTLYLNNADYVTVQNLKFNSTQTGSYYNIYNLCSEKIVIQNDSLIHSGNMNLSFYSDPTSLNGTCTKSKIDNNNFICKSADKKNIQVTGTCDSLYIRNNTVSNTYNKSIGIQLNYVLNISYYAPSNVFISNNTLAVDSIGILINGHSSKKIDNLRIKNNTITIANTDSLTSGLYISYSGTASSNIDSISGNTVIGGRYGMYLNYTTYARAINNYFINNQYGTRLANSTTNYFYFNSFNNSRNNLWGSNNTTPSGTYFTNNICLVTGTSSYGNIVISGTSQSLFAAMDYNDFYGPNGAYVGRTDRTYTTLESWTGASHASSGNDAHSISANPVFPTTITNNLEIDLFSPCTQAGNSVSGITADKNGRVRRSLPSIGAFEPKLRLKIHGFNSALLSGTDTIKMSIQGLGIDTTLITPDSIYIYPDLPLSGYTEYILDFEGDTLLCDTLPYAYKVNSLGIIESVYLKDGINIITLDPAYYQIISGRDVNIIPILNVIPYYANLSATPGNGFFTTSGKRLRFYFNEDYSLPTNKKLEYKVYATDMTLIASVSSSGVCTPSNSPVYVVKSGLNRVILDFSALTTISTPQKYYLLEVSNIKGEKSYLRFKM